jgi:dihydropteroate synthase
MEYHEAVNRLEGLRRLRPKLGTETTASLLAVHDDPHENLTAVQIAGSNGKGSTAALLDSILRNTGPRVGLYTSPDLNDIRERIQVQGEKIPKAAVVEFVSETWPEIVDSAVQDDAPTFFEVITAMALWYFDRENVDVAVLEVGIGGRYDATSVVDPVAAAVTTVSLEHTDILGSTVEEIARDKAQVAPATAPLVTGATGAALETIREETEVLTVRATSEVNGTSGAGSDGAGPPTADVRATEREMLSLTEASLSLDRREASVRTRTPMLGRHGALNAGIAATLAGQVADPTDEEIARGVRNVRWPGRFEVMRRRPLVVLDGAHNPAACERLAALLDRFEYDRLRLVFGAMRDKDHAGMVRSLPVPDEVVLAEPAVSRAAASDLLAAVFDRETDTTVTRTESVLGGLNAAISDAGPDECVLVAGSLYAVAEARDRFTRTTTPVRTDTVERATALMEHADVPARERERSADRLVHRTVHFHARREDAATVTETMLSLGGYCCVSGIESAHEHVEVVVSGTLAQFERLLDALVEEWGQRSYLAGQLRSALVSPAADPPDSLALPDTTPRGDQAREAAAGTGPGTDTPAGTDRTREAAAGAGRDTDTGQAAYPWETGPTVMGILNVTPDSFHDGGEYELVENAVAHAERMAEAGAGIVDIGGESTRPGADPVPPATERDRVVPVVEALADLEVTLSVDTRKPSVARAALDAGADIVNDVTGLSDAEMRHVVAEREVPVVVMHSLSVPVDPDRSYAYGDVVGDVMESLTELLRLADRAGIDRSNVVVDPGLGFGKSAAESFELVDRLDEFRALGCPILVGHSHKSMFRDLPHGEDRLAHTIAASALAVDRGADIVRVHDVPENVAAVATAVRTAGER